MNPLLILHGALGADSQMAQVKSAFEKEGHIVHTMNFSGHGGENFQPNFGIEQFADEVLQYLNSHKLEQVDIFGYSMGGYVALWLAKNHPERIGKIVTLGTKFDWSLGSSEKEVRKLNAEKILEKVPAFASILAQRHAPNDWKLLLKKTGEMMLDLGRQPMLTNQILESINHSVTVCLGDQDDMADRQYSEDVAFFFLTENFSYWRIRLILLKKLI